MWLWIISQDLEANPSLSCLRFGLRLIFEPQRQHPRIVLGERICFSYHDCKVGRCQAAQLEYEAWRVGAKGATVRFGDLIRSHRQKAHLEKKPSRRRRIQEFHSVRGASEGVGMSFHLRQHLIDLRDLPRMLRRRSIAQPRVGFVKDQKGAQI
jgi:hypothetical protein